MADVCKIYQTDLLSWLVLTAVRSAHVQIGFDPALGSRKMQSDHSDKKAQQLCGHHSIIRHMSLLVRSTRVMTMLKSAMHLGINCIDSRRNRVRRSLLCVAWRPFPRETSHTMFFLLLLTAYSAFK